MDVIFKKGIPGFDNINDFTIKSLKDNDKFKILEAKNGEVRGCSAAYPFPGSILTKHRLLYFNHDHDIRTIQYDLI